MIESNNHLLYRGQSKENYNKPLTSSALRYDNAKFMEIVIQKFEINTNDFRSKCKIGKIPKQYLECDVNAFYAYWLSLVNCAIAVNTNMVFHSFCKSPFFYNNFYKDGAGIFNVNISEIGDMCYDYAKDFFDNDKELNTMHIQYILHDYAFFQHLNHVFSKLDGSSKSFSPFPTLAMDWTWDYNIAKEFAGYDGNILSINFDAYKKWSIFKDYTISKIIKEPVEGVLSKTVVFGFESYRDTENWNDKSVDWDSWDNNLMIQQKGAVIFWPWTYTIDEMKKSELGKIFEFNIIK